MIDNSKNTNKINLLLTTANGQFLNSKELIKRAVEQAKEYAFIRLKIEGHRYPGDKSFISHDNSRGWGWRQNSC